MQVAIVSTDGINVDEHFGRAERFLIYEISGKNRALLTIKVVGPLSEGDPGHDFNRGRFAEIADKLTGCRRVYGTRIGDKPAAELRNLGIGPVVYDGPIAGISV